jgi:periplasmic protein TonB
MYADRYVRPARPSPAGLGAALVMTGALVGGLIFSAPNVVQAIKDHTFVLQPINAPKDPPPKPLPKPLPQAHPQPHLEQIVAPKPVIDLPPLNFPPVDLTPKPQPPLDPGPIGTGTTLNPPAEPPAALIGPQIDGRYADAFQPTYPPSEIRSGREGRVVVRVLIGPDGRVQQVERVNATSDAFYAVTEHQALTRWRFRPATRGGVPEAAWKTIAVSFVLNDLN